VRDHEGTSWSKGPFTRKADHYAPRVTTPNRSARPLVAVIGSVDPTREFTPPLKNTDIAPAACRELGRELARAGCDLAVFSSKPKYVERYVVEGYAQAHVTDGGGSGTVFVHLPRHRQAEFAVPESGTVRLQVVRDTSPEWEVSFYRTLVDCDGALLIGGGQSTRVAGIVAMSQRVPLLPVAAFGGGAGLVWVNLDKVRNDAVDEDLTLLGADWEPESAARLAACLLGQRERRTMALLAEQRAVRRIARKAGAGMAVAALLMTLSLVALVVAGDPGPAAGWNLTLLLGAPLLASIAGAIVRNSFETEPSWPTSAVRGLGAGLVSVLLYVATQLLTLPNLLDQLDVRRLLFFVIPLGFSAGLTFDLVYERLRAGAAPSEVFPPIATAAPASIPAAAPAPAPPSPQPPPGQGGSA
jgi:hypothetical protein